LDGFSPVHARRALLGSLVCIGMGQTVLFAVLAPIGRELGLSEMRITSIIAASSIAIFVGSQVWGRVSDVWGRKPVMLVGIFGFVAGTTLFNSVLHAGFAGILVGTVLWITLIVSRVLNAIVMSAAMPTANAYMADITDVSTRTRGMGAVGAANNLGAILGPAVGGALASVSLMAPLWFVAVAAFLNGLFVWRRLPEPPRHTRAARPPPVRYGDRRILPFEIVGVLMFTGFGLVQQTMAFRLQDALGLTGVETAQTFGLGMMMSAGASLADQTMIVQRFDLAPFTLLTLAMPLLIVAFTIMATIDTRAPLLAAMAVQGLGMGLAGPGFMAGASLAVSAEEQGAVAGVAASCGPLGFTLGPLVGGALYQADPNLPYALSAGVYVGLFAALLLLMRRRRR
jgi:MFS family permease